MGSCESNDLQPTMSYNPYYDSSRYNIGVAIPTEYIKVAPISLREELIVEEVKLKGIDIELDAIL